MQRLVACKERLKMVTDEELQLVDRCAKDTLAVVRELLALRKDAERYRWHKARNPSMLLANAWGASRAACAIGEDPDAATDAAMLEAPAVGAA